jgi:hypothetical protein
VRGASRRDPIPQASTTPRFVVLDGSRGLATLPVVLYNPGTARGLSWLGGRAYLAVDFLFVLSGFVLAHACLLRFMRCSTPLWFLCSHASQAAMPIMGQPSHFARPPAKCNTSDI